MKTPPGADCCPSPNVESDLRPVEGPEADDELAALAKAIGHPARVERLKVSKKGGAGELDQHAVFVVYPEPKPEKTLHASGTESSSNEIRFRPTP